MKKVLFTMIALVAFAASTFACDLESLLKGNTTLANKVRAYERQGYVLVLESSSYNQVNYFAAPTAPYLDGTGVVVMRKSAGNYSLETTYVNISFDATEEATGRCTTQIIDITTQTVY